MKKNQVNRRTFLKLSATTVAGSLFIPGASASITEKMSEKENDKTIPERMLGRTGIRLSILSMGVMRADNSNVVRAAYNSGLIHFDTAHGYQNGKNEEMLGSFFKGKPRDKYVIATKVKFDYPLQDNFEKEVEEKLETSLKRLQMDYVDIFYAHAFDQPEEVRDPRIIEKLKQIKDSGKAKYIGFSTHAHKPEQIHAAVDAGIYDVILLSYNFKLQNLQETEEAIKRAGEAGIGLVAMKTMTGGTEDAEGKKKINAQACLKWVWNNKYITTIIPGFSNYDELEECLAAAHNPGITAAEEEYLAALCNKESLFCQQCGKCRTQCPEKLPIPDMMRAYMYAYGYKYSRLSKETLQELDLPDEVCASCKICKVTCPSGFNVAGKIAAITPVRDIPYELLS
ncbi:MAG: aldo/keto reductase [Candidatus Azobacteroides sp.]|nr:aldo/keto reductase [Candidatus Azobacteroides sp.]